MAKPGKTLIISLSVLSVLLLSLTIITFFYYRNESELRKQKESVIGKLREEETKLNEELKAVKKEKFLLEEKAKEADEKINGLLDELELEAGLREEMKIENSSLREALKNESEEKQDLQEQILALQEKIDFLKREISEVRDKNRQVLEESGGVSKIAGEEGAQGAAARPMIYKIIEEEKKLKAELEAKERAEESAEEETEQQVEEQIEEAAPETGKELEEKVVAPQEIVEEEEVMEQEIEEEASPEEEKILADIEAKKKEQEEAQDKSVDLKRIVIVGDEIPEGKVLHVNTKDNFIIFDLGHEQGIEKNLILSVYRDDKYIGDIKVVRVQSTMSVADIIPPITARNIRKDYKVVIKE